MHSLQNVLDPGSVTFWDVVVVVNKALYRSGGGTVDEVRTQQTVSNHLPVCVGTRRIRHYDE